MITAISSNTISALQSTVTTPSVQPRAVTSASFGDVLGQLADGAIGAVQKGEAAAIQGMQGGLAPVKVVDAIMSAERALQTAIAIKDKAVSAYQEISRMAI